MKTNSKKIAVVFAVVFAALVVLPSDIFAVDKGTLMSDGKSFCCSDGTSDCAAAQCTD
jgi:hypothetical protein